MGFHKTKTKGDIGVAHTIARLTELGWSVGVCVSEHAKYDLFAEKDGIVHTVQVRYTTPTDNKVRVPLSSSCQSRCTFTRRARKTRDYTLLAVYVPGAGVYFVKDEELGSHFFIMRLGQRKGHRQMRWAEDYETP